jgi:hypothetical protein
VFRGAREPNRLGPVCGHSASRQQRNRVSKTSENEWMLANASVAVVQSKAQAAVSKRLSTVRRKGPFLAQSMVLGFIHEHPDFKRLPRPIGGCE